MILCNFSNTNYHLNWYQNKWQNLKQFLHENNIDGVELLLHGNYDVSSIPSGIVKGLHLSYFPTWLEFYNEDEKYKEDFPTSEDLSRAFGGTSKQSIIDSFKMDFEIAKKLNVSYMVFHVSHVTLKDAFHFSYNYSNRDVIDAAIDLVNKVFYGDSDVTLLFENLWWPGLTLLSKDDLDYLIENINYKNCGVMLDLSHLLITGKDIKSIENGTKYIIECINNLGNSKKWIKGLHINSTLNREYLNESHGYKYELYKKEKDEHKKFEIIHDHIHHLDSHKPYSCYTINDIINLVEPKYKVIEVIGQSKAVWESYIQEQLRYIEV